MKPRYVLGFVFNKEKTLVLLQIKSHPAWQKDRLNGFGREVLKKERVLDAMRESFLEQTAAEIEEWKPICNIYNDQFTCKVFAGFTSAEKLDDLANHSESMQLLAVGRLNKESMVESCEWLIPLCCDERILNGKLFLLQT